VDFNNSDEEMACIEIMSLRQKQQRTERISLEEKKKERKKEKTAQGSLNGALIALINQ